MNNPHTKRFFAAACLFALLFLTACAAAPSGEFPADVSEKPEKSTAPAVTAPAPPPDSAPAQAGETAAAQADTDTGTSGGSNPEQPGVSGVFTGVLGTEFLVPEGFIRLDETANIGYQYTFWHPDYEVRIVVYEIAPGYIPEGAYDTDYSIAERNPDVTYFSHGENWFVQSGYDRDKDEIFYSKECATDRGLKTFWISYPTARREFGDPITADFERNCRF